MVISSGVWPAESISRRFLKMDHWVLQKKTGLVAVRRRIDHRFEYCGFAVLEHILPLECLVHENAYCGRQHPAGDILCVRLAGRTIQSSIMNACAIVACGDQSCGEGARSNTPVSLVRSTPASSRASRRRFRNPHRARQAPRSRSRAQFFVKPEMAGLSRVPRQTYVRVPWRRCLYAPTRMNARPFNSCRVSPRHTDTSKNALPSNSL